MSRKQQINSTPPHENHRDSDTPGIDAAAVILGAFLNRYHIAESFYPGVTVMTTDEIISSLSEMADISQATVNTVLASLGFRPGYSDTGTFGWLMQPASE